MTVLIAPADTLGADTIALAAMARDEGFSFAGKLLDEWRSGANRFMQPGEAWLEARDGGVLVGFGGLNRCPYTEDPSVGRLRHLYVRADRRAEGVGRALVEALLSRAGAFARVRLRAADGAGPFYDRLGFSRSGEADATHSIEVWKACRQRDAASVSAPHLLAVTIEDDRP
jgi:GNAT superfamily N-acetyltransferase